MKMKESAKPSQAKVTNLGFRIARWEYTRLMDWATKHCLGAEHICEIGPGRGHVYRWHIGTWFTYTAIDQTDVTREMIEGDLLGKLVVAKVPPLPYIKADIYVLFALLEHMDGPKEARKLMNGIYANLNPGGIVVILVPDIRFDGRFFWENSMEHNYVTSMQRVSFLLEECGFKVVQKEMVVSGIRLPLGYLIAVPARILRWLYVLLRPCSALTTVHKVSIHTPLAFLVGKK